MKRNTIEASPCFLSISYVTTIYHSFEVFDCQGMILPLLLPYVVDRLFSV
jgi:hypothetical protein